MYIFLNPNPCRITVGDCVVRAIAIAEDLPWDTVFKYLSDVAINMCDMPSSNEVWAHALTLLGYDNSVAKEGSVWEFAENHRKGTYIIGTGTHAVCVIDGDWYDIWDSGFEIPLYYFYKKRDKN